MRRPVVAAGAAAGAVAAAALVVVGVPPAMSAGPVHIDAGGSGTVVAADGTTYTRSSGFDGGRDGTVPESPVEGRLGSEVLATTRVGMSGWSVDVPDGRYRVTLAMAEVWWTASGRRVFSATAEDERIFRDLDLYDVAGARTEVDRSIEVQVDDGSLDIGFTASRDLPIVSAIDVVPVDGATTEPTPTAVPTTTSPSATATEPAPTPTPPPTPTPSRPTSQPAVLAAAGDLVCDPADPSYDGGDGTSKACRQADVSDLLLADDGVDAFAALGDLQYSNGTPSAFRSAYHPTYGRILDRTIPVAGNHEYGTRDAAGYYGYFGARAGDPARGYYSRDLGSWHVVVLNTNCGEVGGCPSSSAQAAWLRADLAASDARCTVVLAHHPFRSSGEHGSTGGIAPLWRELYDDGADLVLVGHDHDYERFAPLDRSYDVVADGQGIRQFVVGTGGKGLRPFAGTVTGSRERQASAFGYLRLALGDGSYTWDFRALPSSGYADSGTGTCR